MDYAFVYYVGIGNWGGAGHLIKKLPNPKLMNQKRLSQFFITVNQLKRFIIVYQSNKSTPFYIPDSLFTLSLPYIWFLVTLGKDILQCCSNNCSLKLLCSLGSFFRDFLLDTLSMFPSIKDSPGNLSGISFQKVSLVTSSIQEFKCLKNSL